MLTSARRREQRARFGALLAAPRAPPADHAQHASGFSEANVRAAGPFGALEPDVLTLLFGRVLRAGHELPPLDGASGGDRVGPAAHRSTLNAAADVYALARTCKYMTTCFGYSGSVVRLEAAAATCTSIAPTMMMMPQRASSHKIIDTPLFDQFVQEERSRFDVQMLESALLSMVTHCTGMHCYAMRRAHNLRIGKQVPERLQQDVMLRHLLGGQKPLLKVVHTSCKELWTPLGGLDTRTDQPECVVATVDETNKTIGLACLRDEPPLELTPNTALRRMWTLSVPEALTGRVKNIALSPCGRWVALVCVRPLATGAEENHEYVLTVWNADRPAEPCGLLRLHYNSIQTVWFRQADVAARHAADGVYHSKATILCFCATRRVPIPLWRAQLNHWYPNAHPIGITKVYQYCLDDGSLLNNFDEKLLDWQGLVLKPAGTRLDTSYDSTLSEQWWANGGGSDMFVPEGNVSDETSIVSISLPSESCDSFGACLFGLADVKHIGTQPLMGYRSLAVQQGVVLDLSYAHRNGDSAPLLRPTLSMQSVTGHVPPLQQFVQLSPRGDLAVVMVQGAGRANSVPVNAMFTSIGYHVHILGRRGAATQFTPLASLDLNQSVHRFRTERALAAALTNADKKPRPEGHVRIRAAPISRAFSPCGRFLLYGFSEGIRFSRSEEGHQAHMEPPLHADGGMCVFDLSEIWEAGKTAALAWIECKADVVPLRMRWTPAGLWLTTRRGPLLLGTASA